MAKKVKVKQRPVQSNKKTIHPTISVVMIAKDEEKYLPKALISVVEWVDEIVLVDTGSSDRTVVIAQSFGAQVYHRPWRNDFSLHRNQALELASGDWCLQLDADEELDQNSAAELRKLISQADGEALLVNITNIMADGSTTSFNYPRIFRKKEGVYYYRKVHNQINIPGPMQASPIVLYHHGYAADSQTMDQRHQRRVNMMRSWVADEPDNWESYYYLAQTLVSRDDTAAEAVESAKRALDLAKQKHIKPDDYARAYLPLLQALNILNNHEALFQYAREWSGAQPGNPDPRLYGARAAYGMNQFEMVGKISDEFVRLHREAVRLQQQGNPMALNSAGLLYSVLVIWCIAEVHLGNLQKAVEIILAIKSLANANKVIQLLFDEAEKYGLQDRVKELEQRSISILLPKLDGAKPFRILSLYFGRDANVCLMENGRPLLLMAKERLTGIRHDQGQMLDMLPQLLDQFGWSLDSIDLVAINPYLAEDLNGRKTSWDVRGSFYTTYRNYDAPNWSGPVSDRTSSHKLNLMGRTFECIAIDRHLAQIALAFFTSPFKEAGVLSADSGGDGRYLAAGYGRDNRIEWLEYDWGQERNKKYSMLNPGGAWVEFVERHLGLSGKAAAEIIMSLSAYGEPKQYLVDHWLRHMKYYWDQPFPLSNFKLPNKLDVHQSITHDICASLQEVNQQIYQQAAEYLSTQKANQNICLTGDCSLNGPINTSVHCGGLYEDSFVPASISGSGAALGQALYVWRQILDQPRDQEPIGPYLGTDIGPAPMAAWMRLWRHWLRERLWPWPMEGPSVDPMPWVTAVSWPIRAIPA
jgi:glycosyltransferase involved in cell wall biosynthesis